MLIALAMMLSVAFAVPGMAVAQHNHDSLSVLEPSTGSDAHGHSHDWDDADDESPAHEHGQAGDHSHASVGLPPSFTTVFAGSLSSNTDREPARLVSGHPTRHERPPRPV